MTALLLSAAVVHYKRPVVGRRADILIQTDKAGSCPFLPVSGVLLEGERPYVEHGHKIRIKNGTRDHAFIRVKDLISSEHSLLYLDAGDQGLFENLVDGLFEIKFAFGGNLAADCLTVANPKDIQKFPDAVKLINSQDPTGVTVTSVTYTLYTVRNGNTRSRPISLSEFNRD